MLQIVGGDGKLTKSVVVEARLWRGAGRQLHARSAMPCGAAQLLHQSFGVRAVVLGGKGGRALRPSRPRRGPLRGMRRCDRARASGSTRRPRALRSTAALSWCRDTSRRGRSSCASMAARRIKRTSLARGSRSATSLTALRPEAGSAWLARQSRSAASPRRYQRCSSLACRTHQRRRRHRHRLCSGLALRGAERASAPCSAVGTRSSTSAPGF